MLIKCPECNLQVSNLAETCPHCGYPLKYKTRRRRSPNRKEHRRLPNGFGRITCIRGQNLRNPYRAMITVGKTEDGKLISKILKPTGYFKTYNDAYAALVEYNKNPYDLDSDITMNELFDKWFEEHSKKISTIKNKMGIETSWKYCSSVYDLRVVDLRARHIKWCIENGTYDGHTPPPSIKLRIKSIFNMMMDYAVEYDIVNKNCSRSFNVSEDRKKAEKIYKKHIAYTDEEMHILWSNLDVPYVDAILIQCYSGWRPQELGLLKIENINFEDMIMVGGMKTKAGTDRTVPIHPKILPLIRMRYANAKNINSEYLFNCLDTETHRKSLKLTYNKFLYRYNKIKSLLGLNPEHRPHDGRKKFITLAKNANVDEYAIKYIVGHSINDITEKIYTERNIEWLKSEMNKIE